jgi:hypothetical protein
MQEVFVLLRGLIIGIAVSLSATVFTNVSWSQSQSSVLQKRRGIDAQEKGQAGLSPFAKILAGDTPFDIPDYDQEISKSLERLNSETERLAIKDILAELDQKSNREILALKLAPDVCQEIACRGVSPDTAHRYVEAYADKRVNDDAHQTALRNAAAAERSVLIAAMAASVSLLSLLISGLSYRRTGRNTKSAIPA